MAKLFLMGASTVESHDIHISMNSAVEMNTGIIKNNDSLVNKTSTSQAKENASVWFHFQAIIGGQKLL